MMRDFISSTRYIELLGHQIYCRYREGTSDQTIAFLHGYPTSGLDYKNIWSYIPEYYNVIVHDHLGFGMSDKPLDHDYTLMEQADIALALYDHLDLCKIHLVAHDYGTSIATEIIARNNDNQINATIDSLTLSNGSMLINMAKLRWIQRLLKNPLTGAIVAQLSNSNTFHRNMINIWSNPDLYDQQVMESHWQLLISNGGKKVLPIITRYINQRHTHYNRWIGALRKTTIPTHILWAADDPVAIIDMAHKLEEIIPNNHKTILENCGHYPMIEQPKRWIDRVLARLPNTN